MLQAPCRTMMHPVSSPHPLREVVRCQVAVGLPVRAMTIKLERPAGTKKRSIEEQLKKLKESQEGTASEDTGDATAKSRDGAKGGTMTLAMRLSQSLKDPLRSKDFLGQVSKGDIQVECHHHSKFMWLKNPRGLLSEDAVSNLSELIQISDTNWYERFGVLKGGEVAFCGGSDSRVLAAMGLAAPEGPCPQMEARRGKYELCYLIAKSPKPRIALMDGNCLGAGAGLVMAHHSVAPDREGKAGLEHYRVATDRTIFSLQHAHFLGMFPGFGLSYFLPKLKGHLGRYLALSGVRINGADCLFAGVATHFMAQHRVDRCFQAITQASADISEGQLKQILDDHTTTTLNKEFRSYLQPPSFYQRYAMSSPAEATHLEANFDAINRCFGAGTVEEMMGLLEAEGSEWAATTLSNIRRMAPTALQVTFRLLRQGSSRSLEEALRTEWRLARRFYSHPDFFEAVRAFEIDKDGAPKWAPAPSPDEVNKMFAPMSEAVCRPLELSQQHLNAAANSTFKKGEMRV